MGAACGAARGAMETKSDGRCATCAQTLKNSKHITRGARGEWRRHGRRRGRGRDRHGLVAGLVVELGKVLVEDGGDLGVEGGLVLDDGREDGKELDVHVGVREVARGREELLAVGLRLRGKVDV